MPDYTPTEIVDILLILGETHNVFRAAERLYRERYPNRRHPSANTIRQLATRARHGHLRRQRQHKIYDENDPRVLVILAYIHLDPQTSSRIIERETGIPYRTVLNILKKLNYHAYHITLVQALGANDMLRRVHFCNWALERIQETPDFFNYVMFSDEATFKSNGNLNTHNCHYYSDVNPHWHRAVDTQHRWSLVVWCGIVNGYLIGPYFFDQNVTGLSFLEMLRDHLPHMLENVDLNTRINMWMQLDGAAPHYSRIIREYLNVIFPGRWIGRAGPTAWPPRSPDLTSPDFFLWGYLKNIVYAERPTTIQDMQLRIRNACADIPRGVLLQTIRNFQRRIELCLQVNGANFEHFIRG